MQWDISSRTISKNMKDKFENITTKTEKILYYLLLSGGVLAASFFAPKLPYEILKNYLKNKKFNKSRFNRDIKRLSSRGDIKIGNNQVSITKQGKERVLKYKLDDMILKKQTKWDGRWRVVVFDIPDYRRKVSNILRWKLISLGFIQYQKSIFIIPYPCRDEIDFIKEVFEISPHVKLIEATWIDDQDYFLRKFHLI